MKESKRVHGYSYPERGKNSLISITKDLISRIYASGATYDKVTPTAIYGQLSRKRKRGSKAATDESAEDAI